MGFLGRITGWDRQKDAHNAVLASHLAETASPELRREIVKRLILIQQHMRGAGAGDPYAIVADLSNRPRIVQMNFIALACNSMGIPPSLNGLYFEAVENPYRSDNENSLMRIGVALDDLSRRSGRQLSWPGNHVRVDFLGWSGFGAITRANSSSVTSTKSIDPQRAADLAFKRLLASYIPLNELDMIARELSQAIDVKTDHELALATALFIFEQEELQSSLIEVQMMARLSMVEWLQDGKVGPAEAKHFENRLYRLYKP
jgi:hypothetical protein